MTVDDLIKILQASIGPVVLISGVALLLLTLTNRLGRVSDRIRMLCQEIRRGLGDDVVHTKRQIGFLYLRSKYLRMSIILSILAIVCVSVIIFALFSIYIFHLDLIALVEFLFSSSLIALILSLLFFLRDVLASLQSLQIEIDITMKNSAKI